MNPLCRTVALTACALIPACVLAAPEVFMGEKVREKIFTISGGQQVTLHVTDKGPIPEESDGLRFDFAGPSAAPRSRHYRFMFAISITSDKAPSRITVEDVSGPAPVLLVDDASPRIRTLDLDPSAQIATCRDDPKECAKKAQADAANTPKIRFWRGTGEPCDLTADSSCTQWLKDSRDRWVVYRAVFQYPDGSMSTLNQAVHFGAGSNQRILDAAMSGVGQ